MKNKNSTFLVFEKKKRFSKFHIFSSFGKFTKTSPNLSAETKKNIFACLLCKNMVGRKRKVQSNFVPQEWVHNSSSSDVDSDPSDPQSKRVKKNYYVHFFNYILTTKNANNCHPSINPSLELGHYLKNKLVI